MKTEGLRNPVVRAVVSAIRDGNRSAFFDSFAQSATPTDDGDPQPFAEWAEREIFRAHGRLNVEREERDGLEITGTFYSDRWNMETACGGWR